MVSRIDKVQVIVHIHGVLGGTVDNVCHSQTFDHDSVVIAVIVNDKHAFAFFVVRGDEAPGVAETLGGETGDGFFGFRFRHISFLAVLGGCWMSCGGVVGVLSSLLTGTVPSVIC